MTTLLVTGALLFLSPASAQLRQNNNFNSEPISLTNFKNLFNQDTGKARLVLLFSPTWSQCISGAGAVQQNILQQSTSDALQVYVVWQRILPNDTVNSAKEAASTLFNDRRVRHMWDPAHVLGFWYKKEGNLVHKDQVVWDAYYYMLQNRSGRKCLPGWSTQAPQSGIWETVSRNQ